MTVQSVTPPKADQIVIVKKTKRSLFRPLIFILLIISSVVSALNVYLFFFYHKTVEREVLAVSTENDDTKSALEIEESKLSAVMEQPKLPIELTQTRWSSVQKVFEVLSDGTINSKIDSGNPPILPIVFKKELFEGGENWDFSTVEYKKIIENLEELVLNDANYEGLELDASLMVNKADFYTFVESLSEKLTSKGKRLIMSYYPRWGDNVSYEYFKNYSKVYGIQVEWSKLVPYVDEVRIKAFDYTTCYSVLAGPITPYDWVEKTLRYIIAQGLPRDKIVLGINTLGYRWTERDYVTNDLDNFIDNQQQCVVFSTDGVAELLQRYQGVADSTLSKTAEQHITYTDYDTEYILVNPSNDYINALVKLAADYGIKGVIYR